MRWFVQVLFGLGKSRLLQYRRKCETWMQNELFWSSMSRCVLSNLVCEGWFIIFPAYPVGCIFFQFSRMFRTSFGGIALYFVPLDDQSKNVSYPLFKFKPRNFKKMTQYVSHRLQSNDVIIIQWKSLKIILWTSVRFNIATDIKVTEKWLSTAYYVTEWLSEIPGRLP